MLLDWLRRCGQPDPPVAPARHQKISSALPSGNRCRPGSDRTHLGPVNQTLDRIGKEETRI